MCVSIVIVKSREPAVWKNKKLPWRFCLAHMGLRPGRLYKQPFSTTLRNLARAHTFRFLLWPSLHGRGGGGYYEVRDIRDRPLSLQWVYFATGHVCRARPGCVNSIDRIANFYGFFNIYSYIYKKYDFLNLRIWSRNAVCTK